MISRLEDIIKTIQIITDQCKSLINIDILSESELKTAEINCKKLERFHSRFSSELNNYFRLSTEPSADDICKFSTIQLQSEEILAELTSKLENSNERMRTPTVNYAAISSKLPKLNLPEFDGDILHWQQFWDHFSSNIDKRELPDIDKLLYLQSSLTGEAKKTIEGLEITHKNYQIALSALKERYGKESQIVDAHYAALYKVKPADKTANDCRRALNEIERHIRVLHSLGENTNHNHLRFIIIEKFPEEVIYEMKMGLKTDNIMDMRKQLEIIISAREDAGRISQDKRAEGTSQFTVETLHVKDSSKYATRTFWPKGKTEDKRYLSYNKTNSPQNKTYTNYNRQKFTQPQNKVIYKRKFEDTNRSMQTEPYSKKRKLSCIFCQGGHYNDECQMVKEIQDRKRKLKDRCFICLKIGHKGDRCDNKRICVHCGDYGTHNRALCPKRVYWPTKSKVESTKTFHSNISFVNSVTILQTAVVTAVHPENSASKRQCRVLLDSGSQRTYITRKLANELNLILEENLKLTIFTFGSESPQVIDSPVVNVKLETKVNKVISICANVITTITNGVPYSKDLIKLNSNEIILADDGSLSDQVDILIGNDFYFSLIGEEKRKLKENLYLIESDFGWILSGQSKTNYNGSLEELSVVTYFQSCGYKLSEPDLPLNNVIFETLWNLESIGITDSINTTKDEEVLKHFNETTKFTNGRYSVCWPWKEFPPNLPTNKGLVQGRLINLLKRLNKEELTSYNDTIQYQLTKGIIEEVPVNETNESEYPIHYLAHHGVRLPGKPTRIVYDGSAKLKESKSLNECLLAGPILLQDLTGLLIRFRFHKIGIIADVEKAFLQIGLENNSRDVTRFLWLKDISKPATEDNILYLRFCRVPFGIISSPFILNAIIQHHLMKSKDKVIQQIANDIYVDNLVTGTSTTLQAMTLHNKLKKEFQDMSMNLREWSSNCKNFQNMIPGFNEDNIIKVLGLNWNREDDTIQIRLKNNNFKNTKRGVLKTIASVYDPCGFVVPSLLASKLFLQELWKLKVKWDTPLPNNLREQWEVIKEDLNNIQGILPRYYIKDIEKEPNQLHCFTDASNKAYAAVIYIVNKKGKGFVMGKSRLSPIKEKNLTIPKMELLGVVIGNRLLKFVETSLQIEITKQFLWTDSQIVIDWFNSDKILVPFVAKRIDEIKRNNKLTIRYIPTNLNPADVATRPNRSQRENIYWLEGPEFLLQDSKTWPNPVNLQNSFLTREDLSMTADEEIKKDKALQEEEAITTIKHRPGKEKTNINNHKNTTDNNDSHEIRVIQEKFYPDEVKGIGTDIFQNLKIFKDEEGILRCKGRLENSEINYDSKYPILLPKNCEFTNRLIMKTHEDNYHVGANHTLSIIRNHFWIPQGKSKVQSIIRHCPSCVKHGGGPFKLPPTPALPAERVNYSSPFTFTGIDYLGPILVKSEAKTEKRWICLFTCLAVRAIHLEVVKDITAEEGIMALRRMMSTRGTPSIITSDNAQYFKLMADILQNPYCIDKKIKWKFIPQLAPWYGGFYERLIGIVKNCMKKTLQKHLLNDSQLTTIIKEIEAVVNTRPLTSIDAEVENVLRPSDFLTLGKCLDIETSKSNPIIQGTVTKTDLIKSWKKALVILQEFKDMFFNRYLQSLRERYNHSHKEPRVTSKLQPEIGQIVQIQGDSKNRETWKVGKIISLIKSADGFYRVAKVKVDNKEFTRSISQLYPLEVDEDNMSGDTPEESSNGSEIKISSSARNKMVNETNAGDKLINVMLGDIMPPVLDETIDESHVVESMDLEGFSDVNVKDANKELDDISPNMSHKNTNKPIRAAAVKALEKIREWTSSLLNIF